MERHRSSDSTHSQEGSRGERQGTNDIHRMLAGLGNHGDTPPRPMDTDANASGSEKDVAPSGDEREESDMEEKAHKMVIEYIKVGREKGIDWVKEEGSSYVELKNRLFENQALNKQDKLKAIEQYIQTRMENLHRNLANQIEREVAITSKEPAHKSDFEEQKDIIAQGKLDKRLNEFLSNDNDIRLEVLKFMKDEISEVPPFADSISMLNKWTIEIDTYLKLRAKTSICLNVMRDIHCCYSNGGESELPSEIEHAVNEIKSILHKNIRRERIERMERMEMIMERMMERMERSGIMEIMIKTVERMERIKSEVIERVKGMMIGRKMSEMGEMGEISERMEKVMKRMENMIKRMKIIEIMRGSEITEMMNETIKRIERLIKTIKMSEAIEKMMGRIIMIEDISASEREKMIEVSEMMERMKEIMEAEL
jgi:hypothetical protein